MSSLSGSYHARLMGKKALIYVVSVLLCAMSVLPFLIMFVNATRESAAIQQGISFVPGNRLAANMDTLRNRQNFDVVRGMFNSFQISALSTVLALYFSTLTAYGLVVYRFKGRAAAFTFIMAVMMIPTQVSIVGFFTFMFKLGLTNTYYPRG